MNRPKQHDDKRPPRQFDKGDGQTSTTKHITEALRGRGSFRGRGRPFHRRASTSRDRQTKGESSTETQITTNRPHTSTLRTEDLPNRYDIKFRSVNVVQTADKNYRSRSANAFRGRSRRSWPRGRSESIRQRHSLGTKQINVNDSFTDNVTENGHGSGDLSSSAATESFEHEIYKRRTSQSKVLGKKPESDTKKTQRTRPSASRNATNCADADCVPLPKSDAVSKQRSVENKVSGQHRPGANYNKRIAADNDNDMRDKRPPQIGFPLLRSLLDKDPSLVALTLTRNTEALIECVQRAERENDLLDILVEVISIAFKSQSTAGSLISLFCTLQQGRLFDIVSGYLVRLQDHIEESSEVHIRKAKRLLSLLLEIMWAQIIRNPSSLPALLLLHRTMSLTVGSLIEKNDIDEETVSKFNQLTQYKKDLQQSKRSIKTDDESCTPPDNFRDLAVLPTASEIKGEIQPFLRKNKTEGKYEDLEHYLDVQFRLLREDFVGPLREGIMEYIRQAASGHRERNSDIRLYENVWIYSPVITEHGLCYKVQFEMTRRLRQVNWTAGKRLMFGSLVCLSDDDFDTFLVGIVINNDDVSSGRLSLQLTNESGKSAELMMKTFKMAETTGYFEAYKHVLKSLQKFQAGCLPFENYIVFSDSESKPPVYLTEDTKYDLRPLADDKYIITDVSSATPVQQAGNRKPSSTNPNISSQFSVQCSSAKSVTVLNTSTWPSNDVLGLDDSQMNAVKDALTREFAIVQGPPGTGKTYIGLKIAKALLYNKKVWAYEETPSQELARGHIQLKPTRPILVVCYTNHALDQFLEGIINFFKGTVIRVGGKSSSEILNEHSIKKYRRSVFGGMDVKRIKEDAKKDLQNLSREIDKSLVRMEIYLRDVLHETFLKQVMHDRHYENFCDLAESVQGHVMVHWLRIKEIEEVIRNECRGIVHEYRNDFLTVDVDVGDRSREERLLNELFDDDTIKVHHSLTFERLRETASAYFVDRKTLKILKNKRHGVFIRRRDILDDIRRLQQLEEKRMKAGTGGLHFHEWREMVQHQTNLQQIEREARSVEEQYNEEKDFVARMDRRLSLYLSAQQMTEEEAESVANIWALSHSDRWRLYCFWIQSLCDGLYEEIDEKREVFQMAADRVNEAQAQEDTAILKKASVIGMTTTGAAKHLEILRNVRPRIVIVEEAAEVLEAHIITTLNKDCDHLILIGDHKQLRPNPAVYRLAVKYNLDLSLFERMVNNGVQYNSLQLQHRMRPEIANIMRHIYPNLKDHAHVTKYPSVKGISRNMYFINHDHEELSNGDTKSYSNTHEAEYVAALCRYLLKQEYKTGNITVLTTYTGQLFEIKRHMPKTEFEGIKITVVDNYQGEENDIVILSLVRSNKNNRIGFLKTENRICVALSRAKIGFYVLGNFTHLAAHSSLWLRLRNDLEQQEMVSDGLKLYCQNHPKDDPVVAKNPTDFRLAPEGGCLKICDARLECGHKCEKYCHPYDQQHELYKCQKECLRTCKYKIHKCKSLCYKQCPPCKVRVDKIIPKCGHTQKVPCHFDADKYCCEAPCSFTLPCGHSCQNTCGEEHTVKCTEKIFKSWEKCGHKKKVFCWQNDMKCTRKCNTILCCEHKCEGTCTSCENGRFHDQCKVKCGRILICGHQCTDTCDSCTPCSLQCENRCHHSRCLKLCGELCPPCTEPCVWKCKHYKCTRLCSEPCNRPPCNKACDEIRNCGHPCIGLCGEPCPPFCRRCDKETVTEIIFGTEDEPNASFVYLEDCHHIIEVKSLDKYMSIGNEESANIQLMGCPRCKTPIRKNRRYGKYINAVLADIERVKQAMIGEPNEIEDLSREILKLLGYSDQPLHTRQFSKLSFNVSMRNELRQIDNLKRTFKFLETEVHSVQLLQTIQIQATLTATLTKLKDTIICDGRGHNFDEVFINKLIGILRIDRHHFSKQETDDANREVFRYQSIVQLLKLMKRLQGVGKQQAAAEDVEKARTILTKDCRVSDIMMTEITDALGAVKEYLKVEGIGIDEDERMSIVKAMDSSKKGHWFKCPNKHIYYIGECGGANQKSKCPECKADIGGVNHRLADGNALAAEMDGASFAAYSEEANNMGNFNLDNLH